MDLELVETAFPLVDQLACQAFQACLLDPLYLLGQLDPQDLLLAMLGPLVDFGMQAESKVLMDPMAALLMELMGLMELMDPMEQMAALLMEQMDPMEQMAALLMELMDPMADLLMEQMEQMDPMVPMAALRMEQMAALRMELMDPMEQMAALLME